MLPTFISNLQTLISSRFLVASFFPNLAFWFGNAAMLYLLNAPFRDYTESSIGRSAGLPVLLFGAALVAITFWAYGHAALMPSIQSILEGNWPAPIAGLFVPAQMREFERAQEKAAKNRRLLGSFGTTATGKTQAELWQESLTNARVVGNNVPTNGYKFYFASAKAAFKLAQYRRKAQSVPSDEISDAVAKLAGDLRAHNADLPGPGNDFALEKSRQLLWDLIDYANDYARLEYRQLVTTREFSFGELPLAPTRMGNVAKTVHRYAIQRYDLNFALFWSRLQFLAQRDKEFGPFLQSAKTQLDFFIACASLTFLWTLTWSTWIYLTNGPLKLFVAVAAVGPLTAYIWYRIAVAQYRTFADLLRSSVDLFRLNLVTAMGYPLPNGVQEERELWHTIDRMHTLYEINDLRVVVSRP
jgi:hypothetical protein